MNFRVKVNGLIAVLLLGLWMAVEASDKKAAKPLFRDPGYDGAADPVVIWNHHEQRWFMFYTNRRATDSLLNGVEWVHGTRIGIAESLDGGASWSYRDTCDIDCRLSNYTHWAPEVIAHEGTYHMYLTYVPGIFQDWNHPRSIIHLTSNDLLKWKYQSTLKLVSDKCIDACVFPLPQGGWRMYYNNERDGKSMYYADSDDLYTWKDSGKKVVESRGEGPKVFYWKETYWLIIDEWKGLGVFRSNDLVNWIKQDKNLLQQPGTGVDDAVKGGHCDVVVNNDRAYVFYFTHPGRVAENKGIDNSETRRSSIQVAELFYKDGELSCHRDEDCLIGLKTSTHE